MALPSFWDRAPKPLLYAHRGASRERPENTLPAFERAVEIGVHVLELDVHATRDGVFVVSHDPTGVRMCNVAARIGESTWAEVSTWDAGWGFVDSAGNRPFAGRGIHPARFDHVLDAFPGVAFNVDVKSASDAELRELTRLIRAREAEPRVLLTSFSSRRLAGVRRAGYAGPTGLSRLDALRLFFLPELVHRRCPLRGQRAQLPTRSGPFDLSSADFIRKCHRIGLGVDYWVVNDPDEARGLIARGADGIITDDPAALAPLFRPARSPFQ